jgi:hypothetical protein
MELRDLDYTADEWKSPHSTISVSSEGPTGIIFTVINVAVTVGGSRQPKTHHT